MNDQEKPKPVCLHKVNGTDCGKPAVCVIKVRQGKLILEPNPADKFESNAAIGVGVASQWIPICEDHRHRYPDHDGFAL